MIYKKRRHALLGERIGVDIANNMYDVCEALVEEHKEANDLEGFRMDVLKYFAVDFDIKDRGFPERPANNLTERLYQGGSGYIQS